MGHLKLNQFVFIDDGDHQGESGHVITLPLSRKSEMYVVQLQSGRGILIERDCISPVSDESAHKDMMKFRP